MDALRTFGDDLDPSNAGNRARFGEDWMNSGLCFEYTRFAIPVDWIGLGFQDFGHSFTSDASHLPKFWGQSVQRFRRSIDWKFQVVSRVPRLC
jgi:hypothetical protein